MRRTFAPVDDLPSEWTKASATGLNPRTLARLHNDGTLEKINADGKNWYRRATHHEIAA